jgi:hypothetical protein
MERYTSTVALDEKLRPPYPPEVDGYENAGLTHAEE